MHRIAIALIAVLALTACTAPAPAATTEPGAASEPSGASPLPSATPAPAPPPCTELLPTATVEAYTALDLVLDPERLDASWYEGAMWLEPPTAAAIAQEHHVRTCVFTTPLDGDGVSVIELHTGLDADARATLEQQAAGWTVEALDPSVAMLWAIDPDPNTEHREAWVLGGDRWLRVTGNLRDSEQVAREVAAGLWGLPAVAPPTAQPATSCETLVPRQTVDEHAARGLVLTTPDDIGIVANHTVESQAVSAEHRRFTCLFAPPGSRDRMVIIQFHDGLDADDIATLQAAADEDVALGYEVLPVAQSGTGPVLAYVSETSGVTGQDVQVFHADTWMHVFTHQDVDVVPAVSQIAERVWG